MRILGEAGIPAGAVLDTAELLGDPDFERRGIMQVMGHPASGPFKMPGWPVVHDGRVAVIKPSPRLGEHNDSVLADWLGLAPAASDSNSPGS
jgi:formyl-CoA transferase